MDAMHCLRMPHGPGGPDRLVHSHSSRRNPLLLRHLAFSKGSARVTAARRWTVCAQAPPPSLPEGEDPNPKGRLGGWHRTRGAAVGAAVVLACALGAACLSRGGGAYCFAQCPNGGISIPAVIVARRSLSPTDKSLQVLSSIFNDIDAAPIKRFLLLQDVVDQIRDDVRQLDLQPRKVRPLRLLAEHLDAELDYYCCLKACRKDQGALNSLYEEWLQLQNAEKKNDLGLSLIELLINQRDYQKALTICQHMEGYPSDPRPHLFQAIIKTMLAVEKMLEPKTPVAELEPLMKEAKDKYAEFKLLYPGFGQVPTVPKSSENVSH